MLDETNVGLIDRAIRFAIGLGLFVLAHLLAVTAFVQALMIVVGATMMVTGLVGYCLLYQMLNVRTARISY